jgi:hypothetical protein
MTIATKWIPLKEVTFTTLESLKSNFETSLNPQIKDKFAEKIAILASTLSNKASNRDNSLELKRTAITYKMKITDPKLKKSVTTKMTAIWKKSIT